MSDLKIPYRYTRRVPIISGKLGIANLKFRQFFVYRGGKRNFSRLGDRLGGGGDEGSA